jgi:putative nucleotidyltransferase with HDIG domain
VSPASIERLTSNTGERARPSWRAAARVVDGLEAALKLRAPRVYSSTPPLRELAVNMARELGVGEHAERLLELCARVRDVGMLGLPDTVVLASGPFSPEQWELITRHPALGADLLRGIAGTAPLAEVVRAHHERWDGAGYPDGLHGDAIPLLSRVIATADAFVALASDRPYRDAASADIALDHISQQRSAQFDPTTVDALIVVLANRAPAPRAVRRDPRVAEIERPRPVPRAAGAGRSGLTESLKAFDRLPAFIPAVDKARAAVTGPGDVTGRDLVAAIESDTGLTVAVLRHAQLIPGRRRIGNVPDAVVALGQAGIERVLAEVPRMAFPWHTRLQRLVHQLRVHGQTVARAAERIAQEVGFTDREDLIAASLLHDAGKLVAARTLSATVTAIDPRHATPEDRIREERRHLTLDHASLGATLIDRWGLPESLAHAVAEHHSSEAPDDMATLVRLADMIARHAHGDPVDRRIMLQLTGTCELPVKSLRDVLFDLPHAGSQRRRVQPSPLSKQETVTLKLLATGKVYAAIADELGLATSTVRTHLHSAYTKMNVVDRAQAVLHATEMGWI